MPQRPQRVDSRLERGIVKRLIGRGDGYQTGQATIAKKATGTNARAQ